MKSRKKSLLHISLFLISFALCSAYFPLFRFSLFAPFLLVQHSHKKMLYSAWIGFFLGLCIDLINTTYPLGVYALVFTATGYLTSYLSARAALDKPLPFLFLSFILLLFSQGILALISIMLGMPLPYSLKNGANDFLLLPFLEAVYAFLLLFLFPKLLFLATKNNFSRELIQKIRKKAIKPKV